MKKTILSSLIGAILVGCGGGGGEEPTQLRIDVPQTTGPATSSSDLTSGKHIPTLGNPNPTPSSTGSSSQITVTIPPQTHVKKPQKNLESAPQSSGNVEPIAEVESPDAEAVVTIPTGQTSQFDRYAVDNPDEVDGNLIHVVYAVPKDGVDRALDTKQTLHGLLDGMNAWISRETDGREFRFDTFEGRVDITYVNLPKSDEDYTTSGQFKRDQIETDIRQMGLNESDKVYLVYYEGYHPTSCGDSANPTLGHGYNVAVLYMANNCHTDSVYTLLSSIHETLHVMGAMSPNAPMHTTLGHTDNPEDIMYDKSLDPNRAYRLDPSRINYYSPNGLPHGLWNLAYSPYLSHINH